MTSGVLDCLPWRVLMNPNNGNVAAVWNDKLLRIATNLGLSYSSDYRFLRPHVLLYTAFFFLCHFLFHIAPKKTKFPHFNQVISILVSSTSIYMSWSILLERKGIYWMWSTKNWDTPWGPTDLFLGDLFCGYFLYDIVFCIKNRSLDLIFHHAFTTLGYTLNIHYNTAANSVLSAYASYELSTPILCLRKILRDQVQTKTEQLSDVNESRPISNSRQEPEGRVAFIDMLFLVTFFVCRGFMSPILTFYVVQSSRNPIIIKVAAVFLQSLSFYWIFLLCKILRKKMAKKKAD